MPRVPINGYIDSATTRLQLRCRLLHGPGAEPLVFFTGDGAGILQPFEFLEFIGHAEANHVAQLVASLLDPLVLPLGHAAVLRYQVDEDSQIGEQDQHDDPNRLGPARYVVTAEQVAEDRDQQPEPQHEDKDRQDVGEKVGESETAREQHANPPFDTTRMPGAGWEFNLRLMRSPPVHPPAPPARRLR